MKAIIVVISMLLFAGCASDNDVKMIQAHYKAFGQFQESQAKQVEAKVLGVASSYDYKCPPDAEGTELCGVAKAFASTAAAREIATISAAEFKHAHPTTGIDAQIKAMETVVDIAPSIVLGVTLDKALDNGEQNIYSNDGDVVNSGNEQRTNSTNIGDGNRSDTRTEDDSTEDNSQDNSVVESPVEE
jgi:hypothetical protein